MYFEKIPRFFQMGTQLHKTFLSFPCLASMAIHVIDVQALLVVFKSIYKLGYTTSGSTAFKVQKDWL